MLQFLPLLENGGGIGMQISRLLDLPRFALDAAASHLGNQIAQS